MHELAIAQSMIEMAERHARQAGAARVTRLRCRVGALCQVDDALLRDAFEIAREGTACEYAAVCIEHCPLTAICHACGNGFEVRDWNWTCPRCGREGALSSGGDELELIAIDAEA